ncbi:XAC2610-related protein [Azonexus sp. IMCC34839]|uniref:XAC2610-related protein n=1 Tax=Azonexus sp. IMCC34839 TaxID=3133695 RepID=UPI00399B95C8
MAKVRWMLGLAVLAWAILGTSAWAARKTYPISAFSEDYHATVTVEDTKDVFRPGAVSVFATKSGKRLIHVESDELAFDVRGGTVSPNVQQLPYGEQSVLIFDDFNFDGRKDLAIMDGQNSCYHLPSFQIFLATDQGFTKSAAFTELAQNFCGMFSVDAADRTLSTMTKSGCCWHQFNTYKVVWNRPVLIKSTEDGPLGTMFRYHRFVLWENGKTTTDFQLEDNVESEPSILRFPLKQGGKWVEVFMADAATLDYALVRDSGSVEFSYVLDVLGHRQGKRLRKASPMFWNKAGTAISFRNGPYLYTIYDEPQRLGVAVTIGKRTVFFEGDPRGRKGAFDNFAKLSTYPENLLEDDPLLLPAKGSQQ